MENAEGKCSLNKQTTKLGSAEAKRPKRATERLTELEIARQD